jgi:hypothetical protein
VRKEEAALVERRLFVVQGSVFLGRARAGDSRNWPWNRGNEVEVGSQPKLAEPPHPVVVDPVGLRISKPVSLIGPSRRVYVRSVAWAGEPLRKASATSAGRSTLFTDRSSHV